VPEGRIIGLICPSAKSVTSPSRQPAWSVRAVCSVVTANQIL